MNRGDEMAIPGAKTSEKHVKWSVTVPARLARLAEEKVAAGQAPSISSVVAQALEHELAPDEDELSKLIRSWIESGQLVIAEEDREWARQVLDL